VQWGHDYKKCALLEDAVLAWVLGYLPENGKQHCNQGLYYLQKDNPEPLKRMQSTRDGRGFDESLKRRSIDFLLDGSCVDIIFGARPPWAGGCARPPYLLARRVCKIFVEQKLQACRTYAATPTIQTDRVCNSLT
jgi:hypothetical protein